VRRYPRPRLRSGAPLWLLIAVLLLVGCSSPKEVAPSPTATTTAAGAPPTPVQIGVSPGGVTTSLSAPASSTEEEYYQACHWARVWMSGRPGDPHAQIEHYLAMIQKSPTGENGSWHTPWAKLPPDRQAGIIVAAQAAADGGCD
jgi:hypothetical protein